MYQYKGVLEKSDEVIAEGHTVEDIENQVLTFRRKQKRNEHTSMNEKVFVYHNYRDEGKGTHKEKLIKTI